MTRRRRKPAKPAGPPPGLEIPGPRPMPGPPEESDEVQVAQAVGGLEQMTMAVRQQRDVLPSVGDVLGGDAEQRIEEAVVLLRDAHRQLLAAQIAAAVEVG